MYRFLVIMTQDVMLLCLMHLSIVNTLLMRVVVAPVKDQSATAFPTRYFYHTAVDKKRVQGLKTHGKKTNIEYKSF